MAVVTERVVRGEWLQAECRIPELSKKDHVCGRICKYYISQIIYCFMELASFLLCGKEIAFVTLSITK